MEAVRCRATAETSLRTAVDSFADIDQPRRERNKWREERQAQTYQKHRTSLHGAAVSDHPAVDGITLAHTRREQRKHTPPDSRATTRPPRTDAMISRSITAGSVRARRELDNAKLVDNPQ